MNVPAAVNRIVTRARFVMLTSVFRVQRKPVAPLRSRRTGPDPVRVLIVGAGVALGYGVRTVDESLNGQLATVLAAGLGRGVTVETVAAHGLPLEHTVERLGPNGAHTFRAVVFVPNLLEVKRGESRRWGSQLRALIAHLQQTGGPQTRIVLAGLPVPAEPRRRERAVTRSIVGTNQHMRQIADELPGVEFAPMPDVLMSRGRRSFDAEFYADGARSVGDVLVRMLAPNHNDALR